MFSIVSFSHHSGVSLIVENHNILMRDRCSKCGDVSIFFSTTLYGAFSLVFLWNSLIFPLSSISNKQFNKIPLGSFQYKKPLIIYYLEDLSFANLALVSVNSGGACRFLMTYMMSLYQGDAKKSSDISGS